MSNTILNGAANGDLPLMSREEFIEYIAGVSGLDDAPLAAAPLAAVEERARPVEWHSVPWAEFQARQEPDLPYLVDGIIPESALGFIAAAPKRGKTWAAIDLAVSVATGTPWLDHDVPRAVPVLYVCLEGQDAALRARIGCLARGRGIDPDDPGALDNLHITTRRDVHGIDLMRREWWDALQVEARRVGAQLVIIDVLRSAAPRLRETGEGASDFALIREGAGQLQAEGITVMLLHHFVKAASDTAPGLKMTGSGALYGSLDVGIFITPTAMDEHWEREMPLTFEARDFEPPKPMTVRIDGEGGGRNGSLRFIDSASLSVVGGDRVERAILDMLASHDEHDGWASQTTIEKAVRLHADHLRAALQRLVEAGRLEHQVGGVKGRPRTTKWYRLPTPSMLRTGLDGVPVPP